MSQAGVSGSFVAGEVPAFIVGLSGSTPAVTGDGTNYTVIFNSIQIQQGGVNFNTSNGIFTAPVSGIYNLSFNLSMGSYNTSTNTGINIFIITTARTFRPILLNSPSIVYGTPPTFLDLGGSVNAYMNTGDTAYIQLTVYGNSSPNITLSPLYSAFSGVQVG